MEQLLQQSDVVSLHCQLTEATRGLIGQAELALMKPGAVLINTSRAHVLDKQALLQALQEDRLGGVGLDVGWDEPDNPQEELYRCGEGNRLKCLPGVIMGTCIQAGVGGMYWRTPGMG